MQAGSRTHPPFRPKHFILSFGDVLNIGISGDFVDHVGDHIPACICQFLPWLLPERKAMVMWPPIQGVTVSKNRREQTHLQSLQLE